MKLRKTAADIFGTASTVGLSLLAYERMALGNFLHEPSPAPRERPPISILKPLCGTDDGLEESLEMFATLAYPTYELLLGVQDTSDAAYPLAQALAARYPHVRVVLQDYNDGLNPKVNQLVTLKRYAAHSLLLISDSNTRPPPGYLDEVAYLFEDPAVGCTTNPVSGLGAQSTGAIFDNLHLTSIGASQVAARGVGVDLVVGKSQGLRRAAIDALGGFEAYANVLAEDYVIGRDVKKKLGLKVALGKLPIFNFAKDRSVESFWDRYSRWAIIQRTGAESPLQYAAIGLLNPIPWAALSYLCEPNSKRGWWLVTTVASKVVYDMMVASSLQMEPLGLREALHVPAKDLLLFAAWLKGWTTSELNWRGKKLQVTEGSKLVALQGGAGPALPAGVSHRFFSGQSRQFALK